MTDTENPESALPDRADNPISEITERFFKAIVAKVPVDRIEELHLFSPLRSGGVETGIAVIAARVPVVVPAAPVDEENPSQAEADAEAQAEAEAEAEAEAVIEMQTGAEVAELDDDVEVLDASDDIGDMEMIELEAIEVVTVDDDSPYAAEVLHHIVEDAIEESIEYIAEEPVVAAVERHTVYTARYRLVQKGPDRGKWEADVVDEADAPLITVEMVVRGVQRRAGEATETTRYTGAQIAHALRFG